MKGVFEQTLMKELETGYIFYNKTYQELCIQEEGKEPDDKRYMHSIKRRDHIEVYLDNHWVGITDFSDQENYKKYENLIGLKVRYEKR